MIGQSKVIEDGSHFERRGEAEQDSRSMSTERRWLLLIENGVLSNIHKYTEIDWQRTPVPRGVKDKDLSELFTERCVARSMNFKDIVIVSKNTPWYSPSPDTESRHHADLALGRRSRRPTT